LEELGRRLELSWKKPLFSRYMFAQTGKAGERVLLFKPLTFMNRSGEVFPVLQRKWKADAASLVVICDNLDLPPGIIRVKEGGSTAGHNGLKSIVASLGTGDFRRIYVGIGRPDQGSIVEHVLGTPDEDEAAEFESGIRLAADACQAFIGGTSTEQVMSRFNRRNSGRTD
jgi:PTH1 family peptidyl-tRNA hydrolase